MELKRSVLLPYAAEDMFDLIEQAEHYPRFLPWCTSATILERSDDWVAANIEFSYLKVRFAFRTRNPKQRPLWLKVRAVEGPFRRFHGDWTFTPLGGLGCRVDFVLSLEVADGRLDPMAAPAAERVSRAMVDAFVRRAHATLREVAPGQEPQGAAAHTAPIPAEVPAADPAPADSETDVNTSPFSLADAVRQSPLAQFLDDDQSARLAAIATVADHAAGDVLAAEGSTDNHLYVVVSGALGLVKGHGTPDEAVLGTLGHGELVHELGFLDGAPRYAALVAKAPTRVLVLERGALESLIDSAPRIVYDVMRGIARTAHRTQARQSMQAQELTNYIVKQHGRY